MATVRVFQRPDGSVRILRLVSGALTLDQAAAKDPTLAGLPFSDVDERALPGDRRQRRQWRLRNGAVVVDATVVVPETPSLAQRLAALEAEVAALKARP